MKKMIFNSGRILSAMLVAATALLFSTQMMAQNKEGEVKVVAHRGYWKTDGSFQNTITALKKSAEIQAYACELDVNMTSDGVIVVCHGPKVGDVEDVQKVTYARMLDVKFKNGDGVPTLEEFLKAAKKGWKVEGKGTVKPRLVLEVKTHPADKRVEVVSKVVALVRKYRMADRTDFIAFNYDICKELRKQMPEVPVQYLLGDKSPEEICKDGIMGIDYEYSTLLANHEWIEQAHSLGMVVNVWTVDAPEKIETMIQLGVDYITTNEPVLTQELVAKYRK